MNKELFEYGGYHFIPERKLIGAEAELYAISKKICQDRELGFCEEGYAYPSKFPYSHAAFMYASTDRLTFLKYIEPYLSRNDFSNILVNAWMSAEYVNQYIDVSKNKLISMFKSANPAIMMDEGEYKQFKNLEDVLTVYRGVTSYNSKSIKVMSWTLSLDTAKWFSNRFGEKGTVYKAHIRKQYVFALLNGRNESEVVVDPEYLTDVIKMQD